MATNFPAGLDTLDNPTSVNPLSAPSHSSTHININDAIEALQAKVGIDNSGVSTSLEYRVYTLENTNSTTGVAATGSTEPASPTLGELFFDSETKELKVYYNTWYVIGGGISSFAIYDAGSPTTTEFEYLIDGGAPTSTLFTSSVDGGDPDDI